MSISSTEHIGFSCPACRANFSADVWTLIDAVEHPELAAELRDGTLNSVVCPQCGQRQTAGAPLLFHDPASRRVYFAVPPETEEHRWREQAQTLLYALVSSLSEADRRPYLGDVQVEHELDGVRRAVLRRDRLRGRSASAQAAPAVPIVREPTREAAPAPAINAPVPAPLVDIVRELLAADSEAQFTQVLALHPELLSDQGDALVHQLADLAYGQGDRAVGDALRELRATLARMRAGAQHGELKTENLQDEPAIAVNTDTQNSKPWSAVRQAHEPPSRRLKTLNLALERSEGSTLSDAAYQALLQVAAPNELTGVARDYPALLEDWVDADLTARIEAALDEGNERLARVIEARREALADLRVRAARGQLLQ